LARAIELTHLQASFPFDGEHNTNIQIQKSEHKAATRSAPPPAPEIKQLRAELAAALEGNEQLKAELAKLMAELAKARQAGADVEQINIQLNAQVAKGRHEIEDSNSKLRESIEVADRLHSELLQARYSIYWLYWLYRYTSTNTD
jgi:chromosome segregation ATPase